MLYAFIFFHTGPVSPSASQGFLIAFVLGSGIQQFPLTYHPPGLEWQEVGRMILCPLGFYLNAVVYIHAFY